MTDPHPIRPLTVRQQQIADGIGRGLTYAEIAGELTRVNGAPMSPHTVASHVRNMANVIDGADELPPRWRIFMWVKHTEWAADRPRQPQLADTD